MPEGDRIALADLAPSGTGRPSLALSRDGTQLVYVIARGDVSQLFLRRLDEFEGRRLPGTEGAFHPFFSPDGQWIGFFTATELKKISVRGGAPQTLSAATYAVGASWGENDTILFAQDEGRSLSRVSADGGDVAAALPDPGGDFYFWWPQLLPDGRSVLVTDEAGNRPSVVVVSLTTGERKTLVTRGSGARYIQSGHLVYAGEAGVMAVPFDPSRLMVTGTPTPVLSDVRREAFGGAPQMAVSADGLLAYIPGVDMRVSTPVWVDRSGAVEPTSLRPDRYGALDLSPDGRHLAITIYGTTTDVWLSDFTPGSEPRRLTTLGGNNDGPAWAGDGSRVAFTSHKFTPTAILWQSIDGGRAQPLVQKTFPRELYRGAWSRNGVFTFSASGTDTGWDIWILPSDSLEPRPLIESPGAQFAGDFSPDGGWLAYQSDQSGQMEVYVTDYPAGEKQILLSTNAGQGKEPIWSPKGDEVFFRSDQHLFSVSVELGSELRLGTPRVLFEGPFVTVGGPEFDVDPEAQRFLMLREPEQPPATQIRLITNWFEEVKAKVGR